MRLPPIPIEGLSGARRVFQCRGIGQTVWKFQLPSWNDLTDMLCYAA